MLRNSKQAICSAFDRQRRQDALDERPGALERTQQSRLFQIVHSVRDDTGSFPRHFASRERTS